MKASLEQRFMQKVQVREDGCWEWTGEIDRYGYGKVKVDGRWAGAHRVAYGLLVGELVPAKPLDHLCHDVSCKLGVRCPHRRCTNPEHLKPTTNRENSLRGNGAAGRAGGGPGRPQMKDGSLCRAGLHPWLPDNIVEISNGNRVSRLCRACNRARQRKRRQVARDS